MLTPAKIKSHQFENSGRNAYKAESVDSFFAEVTESYEQMFRENGEMYKKIGLLAERLEEYRKDEDNIRNALLTAQRMADKITRDAQEKADGLLAEAEERAKTENDRIDAISNDMLQKANYQAQAIVNDAQRQAEKIIEDATSNSKEAAVSARDSMIKEEAALQMMKVEVTKFKKQIMDAYSEQLALIEELPEIVYAKIENEKAAAEAEAEKAEESEAVEETEAKAVEADEEETVEDAIDEIADEVIADEADDEKTVAPDVYFTKADKKNSIEIETLQEMIAEEDTIVEYVEEEEEVSEKETVEESGYNLPDIDAIDEEIERLSREVSEKEETEEYAEEFEDELDEEYDDDNEYDDDEEEEETPDIPFTKPAIKKKKNGFKVNFENVSVYGEAKEADDDDEYDDDEYDDDDGDDNKDNGNEGSLSSKLKGFFRK